MDKYFAKFQDVKDLHDVVMANLLIQKGEPPQEQAKQEQVQEKDVKEIKEQEISSKEETKEIIQSNSTQKAE